MEEENKQQEDETRTTIQSSTAMQQSCTCAQGNCSFPVNKELEKGERGDGGGGEQGGGEGGGEGGRGGESHNNNAVFYSNAAELYSWTKVIVPSE